MAFPAARITSEPALATVTKAAKEMWPFLAGFSFTGYLMIKVAAGITDEDVKKSKFANPNAHH